MANIKVTKRPTSEGATYSISGLTFSQLFRIKCAIFEEAKKMNGIADEFNDSPVTHKAFKEFAQDAKAVFDTLANHC